MRLTIIAGNHVGCLQVNAMSYGYKIAFSGKDMPMEKVFSIVRNQTGYVFFYDYAIFQNAKTVSLDIRQGNIEDVLNACFKGQGLEYKIENKTISITKKKEIKLAELRVEVTPIDQEVIGVVKSEAGSPLEGATINIIKLKKVGTTNEKGEFTFQKIPNSEYKVEIASNGLDATVMIPYGMVTKRLNTGDATKVTSKDIEEQPVSNPLAALKERVARLLITQTTSVPGGTFKVQIRGQNSIANGNDPFYAIDRVPYNSQLSANPINIQLGGGSPLNFINLNDIESIEVLKDADATAIYGSKAADEYLDHDKKGKGGDLATDHCRWCFENY